jgi:hypothetical protein
MNSREKGRMIYTMDLRRCFGPRHLPTYAVMTVAGVLLVVQRGDLSPCISAMIVTLSALEFQFNNLLYRSPSELEALTILPVSWKEVILAKNLATITAVLALGIVTTVCLLFFSPRSPDAAQYLDALLFVWTVIFPLLCLGNLRSVEEPRRGGRAGNGLILAAGMALVVCVCAIPYVILRTFAGSSLACIIGGAAGGWFWLRRSIPSTAKAAEHTLTTQ